MSLATCPSVELLQAFQLGDLPEPSLSEVAAHLESCIKCETAAQGMDTEQDSILCAIRESGTEVYGKLDRPTRTLPPLDMVQVPEAADSNPYPFLLPPRSDDELGRLGHYRVLRLLGKGGMAYVFEAEDLSLGRAVALKVLRPELRQNNQGWQRFRREARLLAAIKHDHLATIYEAVDDGNLFYLAMERLQGETVEERVRRAGPATAPEVLRLGQEIASGLAVIHGHGLIHRDIKPANLWLEAPHERIKILDFGLARHIDDDSNLTHGIVMGTPSFMSPEQARGESVDSRTDLFSLGCVLYCLCTGHKPFASQNTMAALTALALQTPKPVHEVNPVIPVSLSNLVSALLAKNAEDRPASADIVFARLREIEQELVEHPISYLLDREAARQPFAGMPTSSLKRQASNRSLWLKLGLAVAGVAAAIAVVLAFLPPPPRPPAKEPVGPPLAEANATPIPTTDSKVYLSNIKEIEAVEWPFRHQLSHMPEMDPRGGPQVQVKGSTSQHGFFMHGSPEDVMPSITWALNKQFQAFHTRVSLNDGPPKCSPITFQVFGDGKLLWQSNPVTSQRDEQEANVDIKGVDKLKIQIEIKGDVRGAHAAWIEPYVTK